MRDETLSNAIEATLFRFSRYDLTTVNGDILTGIYDRFMDLAQRKKLGEFFTPPSIARYILQRTGVGRDLERGAAEYSDVFDVLGRIAGNDLNTFSSVLAQIQLLWQILGLKADIEQEGFPDIVVTAKVNSLVERDHWNSSDRFAEIEYDAVIGNPPYVRAELSAQDLDARSQKEFERGQGHFPGVSSELNAFALFLYRALDRWCRPADESGLAGKVGFILPVSLFAGNDFADLRKLLALGGRWAIREIVDLEVIYRDVFDADVLPAIVIVENIPAKPEDTIAIRFADRSCVKHQPGTILPEFDLASLPESTIPYAEVFSPDGRILTRLTPARLGILRKLWANQTFTEAAKPFWVLKDRSKIVQWTDQEPGNSHRWEARRMIAGGGAFRGTKSEQHGGLPVYKGENIIAAELQGDAVLESVDLGAVDDISLWRYADIHPKQGMAVAGVAHCPNGVLFDPAALVFTNTATLFFPRDDLADVPFDLLLLSNVYVWFYALAARMGVLRQLRSHVYPTNLALLPWSESLAARARDIEAMREPLVGACRKRLAAAEALAAALAELGFPTLKARIQSDPDARLSWGDSCDVPDHETGSLAPSVSESEGDWRVSLSDDMFDYIELNRENLARGLALALEQHRGGSLTKPDIFNLPMPVGTEECATWNNTIAALEEVTLDADMQARLRELDLEVGKALGLTDADIGNIQRDLAEDAFLRRIRPRYPGTVTRKQGFRTGLDSEDRYT